jgi:hypothetical protein
MHFREDQAWLTWKSPGVSGFSLQRAKSRRVAADHGWNRRTEALVEETLDHLDGYMGSKPARIGNGAYNQLQLDIYGGLLDADDLPPCFRTDLCWKIPV